VIDLCLSLLGTLVGQLTKNNAEQQVVAGVQAAVDALAKVRGSDVTYAQLEGLRVTPKW